MLLDNWVVELSRFFRREAFGSILKLHEDSLRALKLGDGLDLERLSLYQLIFTNYDTLARYQRSLLKLDFDVVVFDEAQHIKNPDTLRSRAARGLKRNFAIALTGTPVENGLADVWAIYDATQTRQPRAFGTKSDFQAEYGENGAEGVAKLRRRLLFPSPQSTLLRREKAEALRDLPPKSIRLERTPMTLAQLEQEKAIAQSAKSRGALYALDALRKLYQHPALLGGEDVRLSPETALQTSPKTRLCLEILERIEAKGEKALVFTLWHQMQELLASLIQHRFRLSRVHIINGEPRNRRAALQKIEEFSQTSGFDVLLLSPIAAGMGLTITAANHVIHYGRWWNPAKEDQATDRAYRIGQTKAVTVYYPTLHRPGQPDAGFDMGLHRLVEKKRQLARDFLAPTDDLEVSPNEIASVFSEDASAT